jgi:carbonic anhydrase
VSGPIEHVKAEELVDGTNSLETAELTAEGFRDFGKGPGSRAGEFIEWLSIPIYGSIYDANSGKLIEVEAATKAGATA